MKKKMLTLILTVCVMMGSILGSAGEIMVQAEEKEIVEVAESGDVFS